jgi:hypothetical protein
VGGDCGFGYVARHYQLRPGADNGPVNAPPGWVGWFDGYRAVVFPQDAGTFQVLIDRRSDDDVLARLRDDSVFDAAVKAIPSVADWVDPDRAAPASSAMSGGQGAQRLPGTTHRRRCGRCRRGGIRRRRCLDYEPGPGSGSVDVADAGPAAASSS